MRSLAFLLSVFTLLESPVGIGFAETGDLPSAPAETMDCGTLALTQLLEIEARPSDWNLVAARLGPTPRGGHSMSELRDVASQLGLTLSGVQLMLQQQPLDRPALVMVKRRDAGHYLVIRPVGTTRQLVQILDGVQAPEIMDVTELVALPGWTGLALIPHRIGWSRWALGSLGAIFTSIFAWSVLKKTGKSRKIDRGTGLDPSVVAL